MKDDDRSVFKNIAIRTDVHESQDTLLSPETDPSC